MIFYFSKYILLGLVIFSCYTYLLPSIKISFRFVKCFWLLIIVTLAIFTYYAEPNESEDLYRYYIILDNFRNGASSISINNVQYIPLIPQLIFSFSSLFDNNGILPSLSIILWGYFTGSVLLDLYKNNKIKLQSYLICLFFLLGNGSVYYIISAIRYTLAFAIWAYGYYFFYKNNKNKPFWLFSIIALLIHKSIFLLIAITIIYNIFIKKCSSSIVWVRTLICLLLFFIIFNTTIPAIFFNFIFLDFIGNSFLGYQNYPMSFNIGNLLRFLILLILLSIELLSLRNKNRNRISLSFFILMVTFVSISMPIFYERLLGLLAIIELPTLINFYNYKLPNTQQRLIFACLLLPLLGLNLFYNIYGLFSHFCFNGEFYQETMRLLMLKF